MLRTARSAPSRLPDGGDSVARFLWGQVGERGGFKDRAGAGDLYYTLFGLEAALALGAELPTGRIAEYLRTFGAGESLDLVHLACLARCRADLLDPPDARTREAMLARLAACRTDDGGFAPGGGGDGTTYACFLALGAYQDLDAQLPDPDGLLRCVQSMRTADGGYANDRSLLVPTTPTTAAAAVMLHQFGQCVDAVSVDWLLARRRDGGGFVAVPDAPIPDLLATATALEALARAGADLTDLAGPCLDFVLGLQGEEGGFRGSRPDLQCDCEYTWYALLALGRLSPYP